MHRAEAGFRAVFLPDLKRWIDVEFGDKPVIRCEHQEPMKPLDITKARVVAIEAPACIILGRKHYAQNEDG
jgi:hypothetical protein